MIEKLCYAPHIENSRGLHSTLGTFSSDVNVIGGECRGVGHREEWVIHSYIKYSKELTSPLMTYDFKDPPPPPRHQLKVRSTNAKSCLAVVIVSIFYTITNFSFLPNVKVSSFSANVYDI